MRRLFRRAVLCCMAFTLLLGGATWWAMAPVATLFREAEAGQDVLQAFDRNGTPLSFHYHARWNRHDIVPLYRFPPLAVKAMLQSEDRRFYRHGGVDWRARASALVTNIAQGKRVRGASSITEQVVRMLHPRPRSLWAKWLEGFEAMRLEASASKETILEFYLNQVPYASGRRGMAQAARLYFDRDLDTLSAQEILALVVLVRAPTSYDLRISPTRIGQSVHRLAVQLLPAGDAARILREPLQLPLPEPMADASHFLRYVRSLPHAGRSTEFHTTLDAALQQQVQHILDQRVLQLHGKQVSHASAIIIDHRTNEVMAWVNAGRHSDIDSVTTARQPGSAMKPFLYALAIERGWTAATVLHDSPLAGAIGTGLHRFRNYSQRYYGKVSLREALGNSLNIPALLTIRYVTPARYLSTLHALGFASLTETADMYDEGLALGVGEVTPFELATAYSALANAGVYRAPRVLLQGDDMPVSPRPVFSAGTAFIIGHILSDPWARNREFGRASILSLPVATAVKTGTSTDYRDAWAAGYNYRYTVVVWMGNLDGKPMNGVTGSTGPALAMRSIFSALTRHGETTGLPMSRHLEVHSVCADAAEQPPCPLRDEYFARGTYRPHAPPPRAPAPELVQPTDRLRIAYDPRIPAPLQSFRFEMRGVPAGTRVRWMLNEETLAEDEAPFYDWQVVRGRYRLAVTLVSADGGSHTLPAVRFTVK